MFSVKLIRSPQAGAELDAPGSCERQVVQRELHRHRNDDFRDDECMSDVSDFDKGDPSERSN